MRKLLKPLQIFYVIYAFVLFVVLMIPVFIFSLIAMPFGRIRGGNLIYGACIVWADIWFALVFIFHRNIYLEEPKKGQAYIYVANHISYLDATIVPKTLRHPIRALGKVEM